MPYKRVTLVLTPSTSDVKTSRTLSVIANWREPHVVYESLLQKT